MEERKPELLTKRQLRERKLKQTVAPVRRTLGITGRGIGRLGKGIIGGLERLGGKPKKLSLRQRIRIVKAERARRRRYY